MSPVTGIFHSWTMPHCAREEPTRIRRGATSHSHARRSFFAEHVEFRQIRVHGLVGSPEVHNPHYVSKNRINGIWRKAFARNLGNTLRPVVISNVVLTRGRAYSPCDVLHLQEQIRGAPLGVQRGDPPPQDNFLLVIRKFGGFRIGCRNAHEFRSV